MTSLLVHFSDRIWRGYLECGVIRFDFHTNAGKDVRFFAFPEKHVMLVHRPWPNTIAPYTEWYVHLVDVYEPDPGSVVWEIRDCEIDIIVEENLQTYRIIDLEDFGEAVKTGQISGDDAGRLLGATQEFLDEYLHGGGRFPPKEILNWLSEPPKPELVTLENT